jgi:hypothetical protein
VVDVVPPDIADFGGNVAGQQGVVDGYVLMFAALLLSAGSLSARVRCTWNIHRRRGGIRRGPARRAG